MEIKITSLLLLGLYASAIAGRIRQRATATTTAAPTSTPAPAPLWTYEEETKWPATFSKCGGSSQSPINIDTITTRKAKLVPIKFNNYDVLPTLQTVTNDGHSLKVELTEIAKTPFVVGAAAGTDRYNFAQYHFHFSPTDTQGSEHTIDTVRYPMELHMVHVNAKYGTLAAALNYTDGLVVLGILFVMSEDDNPALAPLVAAIPSIKDYNSTTHFVQESNLYAPLALLPHNTKRFYRYQGSLTTPTCNEVVTWNVFDKKIKISESQMAAFRTIVNDELLHINNSRPIQPLNGRKVVRSFK